MEGINIAGTIARERRAAGITQDELAAHLGVTKAAVSKWELGQSAPDVALLPRIAAYFSLTLDELFDWRPQLTKDEVQRAYLELMTLAAHDADAALDRADQLAADYYSCWTLLVQVGVFYTQRAGLDPDRADELAGRARRLFERVEAESGEVELARSARMMRAALAAGPGGNLDEGIALLESLKTDMPAGIESMLATMYQQKGDVDACLKLHQEAMGWGVMNVMGSLSMQLPLYADDLPHREALLRAGEAMMKGFALAEENPLVGASFLANAATACLQAGDKARAAAYLARFVDACERLDVASLVARKSLLYDRAPELAGAAPGHEQMAAAQLEAMDLKAQYKAAIFAQGAWAEHAGDPAFADLLARLEAL